MKLMLAVAAGGALGAVGRYLVMSQVGHWLGSGFPFATLTVNVAGSFLLGLLIEASALAWSPAPELRALLVVRWGGGESGIAAAVVECGGRPPSLQHSDSCQ